MEEWLNPHHTTSAGAEAVVAGVQGSTQSSVSAFCVCVAPTTKEKWPTLTDQAKSVVTLCVVE